MGAGLVVGTDMDHNPRPGPRQAAWVASCGAASDLRSPKQNTHSCGHMLWSSRRGPHAPSMTPSMPWLLVLAAALVLPLVGATQDHALDAGEGLYNPSLVIYRCGRDIRRLGQCGAPNLSHGPAWLAQQSGSQPLRCGRRTAP
jgi:hypothetical protein